MKEQTRNILLRTLPIILIAAITLITSVIIYDQVVDNETEDCWEILDSATKSVSQKINTRFSDNITFLDLVAGSLSPLEEVGSQNLPHLRAVCNNTIFERIDLILPSGEVLLMSGESSTTGERLTFKDLLLRGPHISQRRLDPHTGKESIYYFTPIIRDTDGKTTAIISGVMDCATLHEYFPTYIYGEDSRHFVIDRHDGAYIMDAGGAEGLGNLYSIDSKILLAGYENKSFKSDVENGLSGNIAYLDPADKEIYYLTYMPTEDYNFQVCVLVREDVAFGSVMHLKNTLVPTIIVELVMIVIFLISNIAITVKAVKGEIALRNAERDRVSNEARSTFLSSVSHDIRTPLNGIVGMLEIINRHGDDPERLKDCLEKINISTKYLITLANDVLDINEMDRDKFALRSESVNLHELAHEIDVIVQPRAKDEGVKCSIDTSGINDPDVLTSSMHLSQILVNLVGNAIKYNRRGGNVWVSFEEREKDGGWVYVFTVRDNGIGMTEEFQKNMFAAFEQEDAGSRSKYRGHGLGLSIVDRLVKRMGGEITVVSKKDEGSCFTVTLPLERDENSRPREEGASGPLDIEGMKILIVEDNDVNLEIAKVLLSDAGADVITAVNGRLALNRFSESNPYEIDVILMDIMMPEMDGYEATRTIRSLDRSDSKTVPIIAMTANTFSEDIKHCKEAGMNDHVGKPIDIDKLISKIAKYKGR